MEEWSNITNYSSIIIYVALKESALKGKIHVKTINIRLKRWRELKNIFFFKTKSFKFYKFHI